MVHHRNLILLAVVAFILIFSIASVQAKQPVSPGNPALSACLAQVEQLQQTVAKQQITIETLQGQINALQASLNTKEQIIADQQATIGKLLDQIAGQKLEIGALEEQIATMQTLLDGYKNYAPVARTGQTYIERTGLRDDGNLQKGVEWPDPRFTDNNDGTVTDNLTRLVWLKNANCFGYRDWYDALNYCNTLTAQTGSCGLSDNSLQGDWRLPNRNELLSLHDINYENPYDHPPDWVWHGFLPKGHPFINVVGSYYWTSSTSFYNFAATAWGINMDVDGTLRQDGKSNTPNAVWPVRDPK